MSTTDLRQPAAVPTSDAMAADVPYVASLVDGHSSDVPATDSKPLSARPSIWGHVLFCIGSLLVLMAALLLRCEKDGYVSLAFSDATLPHTCTWRNLTGHECPGCGMTRSMIRLMHGHVTEAFVLNPASLLVFGFLVFQVPYRLIQVWRIRRGRNELQMLKGAHLFLLALFGVMLAQWLVKVVLGTW